MVVVHRAFRRESALLPRLVRAVPDGDTARAARITAHIREYAVGLHSHHTAEDDLIWPLIRDRAPDSAPPARMEAQHERIDTGLTAIAAELPDWQSTAAPAPRERLATLLDEHVTVLLEHLDDEEHSLLPLVAAHLTPAEWARVGAHGMNEIPPNRRLLALGAVLEDATPEERAFFLARVPLVGRLAWRLIGRRQYAAACRELRDPLTGGGTPA
jgi:hemerythrin-like domain-containing protein